jgi:hypothetical protein
MSAANSRRVRGWLRLPGDRDPSSGAFSHKGRREESDHAASVFSTSLIQYEVPNTIASSLKL